MSDEWYNLGFADGSDGQDPIYNKEGNYKADYMIGWYDAVRQFQDEEDFPMEDY